MLWEITKGSRGKYLAAVAALVAGTMIMYLSPLVLGTTLDSILAAGDSVTVVFLVTNGATPYYPTAFQVDGSAVTPKWVGAETPAAGNASSVDSYLFTIVKTGAATFSVFGQQVQFA